MKRLKLVLIISCLFAICIPSVASLTTTANKMEIKGLIRNMKPMPTKLYLFLDQKLSDSVIVKNGSYRFTPNIAGITHALIKETPSFAPDGHMGIYLLLNNAAINIVSDRSLNNCTLSGIGAQAAKDYREAIKNTLLFTDTLNNIMSSDAYSKNELLRADIRIRTSFMRESMTQQMAGYLKQHAASPAGAYMAVVIYENTYPSTADIEKQITKIPAQQQVWIKNRITAFKKKKDAEAQARQNAIAATIQKNNELAKQTAIGKQAMEFSQNDTLGNPVSLASFRGKYVLVDFWASWCGPCRAENPAVVKAFHAYKDKGFTILGVSMDNSKQSWIAAIKKDELDWTQVSDLKGWDNSVGKMYNVKGIPANFLLDPNGIIVAKDLRGEELEKTLAALFNK